MRAFVLVIGLLILGSSGDLKAQPIKFRTVAFTWRIWNPYNQQWGSYEEWTEQNILMVMEDDRLTIYTKYKQVYDVISSKRQTYENGDEGVIMKTIDNNGEEVGAILVIKNSGTMFLYLENDKFSRMYQIYELP